MADATQPQRAVHKKTSFFFLPHTRSTAPPTPTSPPSPKTIKPETPMTTPTTISSSFPGASSTPLTSEKSHYLSPNSPTARSHSHSHSLSCTSTARLVPSSPSSGSHPRCETCLPPTPQQDSPYTLAASALPLSDGGTITAMHSLPAARSMDQFVVLEELGNGSFGLVFKARHKVSGDVVAIKKMKKKFTSQSRSLQEVKALEVLRSGPNIVRLHHFFLEKKELHMVFELMEGNLYQLIKDQNGLKLEESRIKSMVFQVLRGLQHMHSKGFMHRDMKPENILVNGDTVKIADLGLSRELKSRPPYTTYVSTRWYRAPEVILRSSAYSCAVDIWAAGTIAAELISLKPLFPGNSDVDQVSRIGNVLGSPASRSQVDMTNETLSSTMEGVGGEWKDGIQLASRMGIMFPDIPLRTLKEIIPNASDESLEMITGLLQYEPKSRLTAYQALHATWFKDLPEAEDLKYLTDVVQQSPDKRRSMFAGFRPSSYKKEGKEKEKEKDRKRGLSVSLPVNREKTASLTAMFLKSDAEPEPLFQQHQLHRESKVVLQQQPEHLHSGFDLPVISPISPFWSDT